MKRYSVAFLKSVVTHIFVACRTPPDEAAIVADHLVGSNLMGLDSHGVVRVPQYVQWIREGTIKPGAPVSVAGQQGGTAVVDCGFNFGQVGALRALEVAIAQAREHKIACVLTRRCNHVGRLGHYTQIAAEAGLLALAICNSPRAGHFVVPFGGTQGRLATNPISYAVAGGDNPIIADMATSTTSEGKIRICANRGQKLPQGLIIDGSGNPTADPNVFYGKPRGWILPLGGILGYKGFALGLLVEILAGTLAGDLITDDKHNGNQGVCFIVIDISAFIPVDRFRGLIGEMIAYMKSAPPAPGVEEVILPGEMEFRLMAERQAEGIPIEPITWHQIQEVARDLDVEIAATQ